MAKRLIDRWALFPNGVFFVNEKNPMASLDELINRIWSAPTVDAVEVVHGRWIWDENAMDWGLGGWICSECQEKNDNIPARPDIYPSGWVGSNYCPNCGSKMDGGKDGR